jgi:hypothetical protein
MPRCLNIVLLLEHIGGCRSLTTEALARHSAAGHPGAIARGLQRLHGCGILKLRKAQLNRTGRPTLRWSLTKSGMEVLRIIGDGEKRYKATWRDIEALLLVKKTFCRIGRNPLSLLPKTAKNPRKWW